MSLGILRIAAVLEARGYRVEMVDLSGIENFVEALADHARTTEARVFGLTATTPQLPAVAKLTKMLRSVRPDSRVILGGPHVTLVSAAAKREARLDIKGRARGAMRTHSSSRSSVRWRAVFCFSSTSSRRRF